MTEEDIHVCWLRWLGGLEGLTNAVPIEIIIQEYTILINIVDVSLRIVKCQFPGADLVDRRSRTYL